VLSRADFIFTIGYDGPAAVVDSHAKRKFGKLSTRELAEAGLFRAAYSSAVHSKDKQEIKFVVEAFRKLNPGPDGNAEIDLSEAGISALNRLFGVFPVEVTRSIVI